MAMSRSKTQQGFTLLEILVAIALMTVVSVISYTSLNSLIEGKQHTDKVAAQLQAEIITSRQLNSDFESIINRQIKSNRGETLEPLFGNSRNLTFARNGYANPLSQRRSELQRVNWFFQNGQLIRRQTQYLEVQQNPQWQQRVYLKNLKAIKFEYVSTVGVASQRWPTNSTNSTSSSNSQNSLLSLPHHVLMKIEWRDGRQKQLYLTPNLRRL